MSSASTTTDHNQIREWVETHGGRPSMVKTGKKDEGGILRIDFGKPEDSLEEISWDEFFEVFDENKLAFLYQDEGESKFNKFVARH
jgi:anaerobic selenocysteine-containing dehydrogenase